VVIVVELFVRRLFDRPIHPFNLAIGPRVFAFGTPVVDVILSAYTVKDLLECMNVSILICELDAIVRCPASVCLQTLRGCQSDVEPV
jgi:hypothetical protein